MTDIGHAFQILTFLIAVMMAIWFVITMVILYLHIRNRERAIMILKDHPDLEAIIRDHNSLRQRISTAVSSVSKIIYPKMNKIPPSTELELILEAYERKIK